MRDDRVVGCPPGLGGWTEFLGLAENEGGGAEEAYVVAELGHGDGYCTLEVRHPAPLYFGLDDGHVIAEVVAQTTTDDYKLRVENVHEADDTAGEAVSDLFH